MVRLSSSTLLAVAGLVLAGCGHSDDVPDASDQALGSDTAETASASSQSHALNKVFFASVTQGATPELAAARVADSPDLVGFSPASCLSVARLGAKTIVHFVGCTGPLGLRDLDGFVSAEYSPSERGGLHIKIQIPEGQALTANGRPITYSAEADLVAAGDERDITWHSLWDGTTKTGRQVHHEASFSIIANTASHCIDISGVTTKGTVDGRGLDTVIDGYRACQTGCPLSGTIRSTSRVTHRSVTIRFDGTDHAHVTGRHGNVYDLPLGCGGGLRTRQRRGILSR